MHFESSNDIASASAMVKLHRSILHSCHRSFRWKAVLPGTSLQRLQALLLRKVVLLLCRRAAMRNHFDDFAEPSPASTSTTASPPPQSTASRMMQLCRMVEIANTAMLNAKGTLHTVFNQVEEFKMLMWDALSTVFSSDQELANAVLDLSQDHAALEEVVQDALMDFASEQQQQCSPTYTTTTLASMTAAPPPFVDHYFPVDVSTASNINQQQLRKQQQQKNHHERSSSSSAQSLVSPGTAGTASASSRGSRGSLNRSDGKLNHSSGSLSSSFLNGSASNLLNCRWGWCKKLVSRQSLVMMLFALVIVSLSTSHRSWQSLQGDSGGGGAAGGVGGNNGRHKRRHDHRHGLSDGDLLQSSLPMQSEQHHHQRVTHNHREDPATSMAAAPQHENKAANLVATTLQQSSSSPSSVADAALRSTAARHKLNNDILDTLRQREKELIASMEQERAMREARRTFQGQEEAALQGQAAPQQAPPAVVGHHHGVVDSAPPSGGGDGVAATPEYPCGKDSVQNPSGLPGRSFDAVDSITALSFDLTDHELDILHKLEAAKLASRHTYVRDLVARAMDADPRNEQSSYHTFFADRNANMETVDIDDVLEDNLLLRRRRENTAFTCPVAEPALVDAVYTYVNPDSASHRMAISKPCRHGTVGGCSEQRFRDFNELMYSLRTVHHQGMHPAREGIMGRVMDDGEDESTATKTLAGRFVGNVYVVVADRDQIPHWLRHEPVNVSMSNNINRASKETSASPQPTRGVQSKGHVFSVTHEEIFPPELQQSALPTFNSFAIESNLHRIPGVRRFFVYFNNDMLWGRRVSYFDYFRPMSHIRQQFRIQTTLEGQCLAEHFRKAAATPTEGQQQQSGGTRNRSATASEMIGVEVDPLGAMSSPPTTRRAVVFMEPIYYFEQQDDIDVRLLIPKHRAPSFVLPPSPHQQPNSVYVAPIRHRMKRVSNGRNVVFVPYVDNIPPPPPQQQQYRERLQQQQQQQQQQQRAPHVASLVSNEANNKSCASRPIKTNAIFRLHMKDHIETLRMTANFNRRFMFDKYGLPPSHAFAHYPGLYDRTILSRMLDEELRDIARKTAADRFRTQDTMWMTMVYPFAALAHRRGVDTALAADHLRLWTRSTSYEHLSLTVSNVGPLMDPNFGKLSKSYQGNMFLSTKAAALANVRPITATLGTIGHEILNEKLRYWLVNMDGKYEPMYSFCMMTVNSLTGCYRDLHNKMKLFVTANDDLASADPVSVNTVHALLRLVSRDAAPAPWERR